MALPLRLTSFIILLHAVPVLVGAYNGASPLESESPESAPLTTPLASVVAPPAGLPAAAEQDSQLRNSSEVASASRDDVAEQQSDQEIQAPSESGMAVEAAEAELLELLHSPTSTAATQTDGTPEKAPSPADGADRDRRVRELLSVLEAANRMSADFPPRSLVGQYYLEYTDGLPQMVLEAIEKNAKAVNDLLMTSTINDGGDMESRVTIFLPDGELKLMTLSRHLQQKNASSSFDVTAQDEGSTSLDVRYVSNDVLVTSRPIVPEEPLGRRTSESERVLGFKTDVWRKINPTDPIRLYGRSSLWRYGLPNGERIPPSQESADSAAPEQAQAPAKKGGFLYRVNAKADLLKHDPDVVPTQEPLDSPTNHVKNDWFDFIDREFSRELVAILGFAALAAAVCVGAKRKGREQQKRIDSASELPTGADSSVQLRNLNVAPSSQGGATLPQHVLEQTGKEVETSEALVPPSTAFDFEGGSARSETLSAVSCDALSTVGEGGVQESARFEFTGVTPTFSRNKT